MKFYEILQEIIKLKRVSRKPGNSLDKSWQTLCDTILEELPEDEKQNVQTWLQEISQNFGFSSSDKSETGIESDEKLGKEQETLNQESGDSVSIHYRSETQTDKNRTSAENVEKLLLPIVKLAYLYERNGVANEHAEKLGEIFTKINDALHYLDRFARTAIDIERQKIGKESKLAQDIPVIHDACLFALPSRKDFSFKDKKWQKLIKDNILNPEFRCLLASAPDLEDFIKEHLPTTKSESRKLSASSRTKLEGELRTAQKRVNDIIQAYKTTRQKRIDCTVTSEENKLYQEYGKNLLEAQLQLVTASAALERGLDTMSIDELKAYYNKYKNQTEVEFKNFLEDGLTKENYAKFLTLKRVDDDASIPPIVIDGKDINYPGYYLRRLNVEDLSDGSLAARLGKKSACCQSLSGQEGESCTIHGLTSLRGGFYVVCKGDVDKPSPKDRLVYQSWVWRSDSDALVIDSAEPRYTREKDIDIGRAFYRKLAYKLVKEHGVPQVCCGRSSGISEHLPLDPCSPTQSNEIMAEYNEYRDSYDQFLMCARDALYLIPGKEAEFFKQCSDQNLLPDHPSFIKMLNFAITESTMTNVEKSEENTMRSDFLKKYKEELLGKYQQIFGLVGEQVVNRCREMYSKTYLEHEKNYALSVKMVCETPYLLDIKRNSRNLCHNLVQFSEEPIELLKQLVLHYPEPGRLEAAVTEIGLVGNVLHLAIGRIEPLEKILALFPGVNWPELVKRKNRDGNSVLHKTIKFKHNKSLQQLLALFTDPRQLALALEDKDSWGNNALHLVADDPRLLPQLLALLPESNQLTAVKTINREGNSVLHFAAGCPECLKQILALYPESSRRAAVKAINNNGRSVLHLATDPESLKLILALYPESKRLAAVQAKDRVGKRVLDAAILQPALLIEILKLFPEQSRIEVVKENLTYCQNNLLHHYMNNPRMFGWIPLILVLLPELHQIELMKEPNQIQMSIVDEIVSRPKLLESTRILEYLSLSRRLEIVKERDPSGDSILNNVVHDPELLIYILTFLPESDRLEAVVAVKNRYGKNVLEETVHNPELFQKILALLPARIILSVQDKTPLEIVQSLSAIEEPKIITDQFAEPVENQRDLLWASKQGGDQQPKKHDEKDKVKSETVAVVSKPILTSTSKPD